MGAMGMAYIGISATVLVGEDRGLVMDCGQDDLGEGHVGQGRLASGNLVQRDAKTPDVCRKIIPAHPREPTQTCTQLATAQCRNQAVACAACTRTGAIVS